MLQPSLPQVGRVSCCAKLAYLERGEVTSLSVKSYLVVWCGGRGGWVYHT